MDLYKGHQRVSPTTKRKSVTRQQLKVLEAVVQNISTFIHFKNTNCAHRIFEEFGDTRMTPRTTAPAPPPLPEFSRGLLCVAELHAWERKHIPLLKTISGYDLYFAIIQYFFQTPEATNLPLKSFTLNMSDRAMRLRMHEFAEQGFIVIHLHHADTRSRSITPTAKLYELYAKHSLEMARVFKKNFHCFRREA